MAIIINPKGSLPGPFTGTPAPVSLDAALTTFAPDITDALTAINAHYGLSEQQKLNAWLIELGTTIAELINWQAITVQDVITEIYATEITGLGPWETFIFSADVGPDVDGLNPNYYGSAQVWPYRTDGARRFGNIAEEMSPVQMITKDQFTILGSTPTDRYQVDKVQI